MKTSFLVLFSRGWGVENDRDLACCVDIELSLRYLSFFSPCRLFLVACVELDLLFLAPLLLLGMFGSESSDSSEESEGDEGVGDRYSFLLVFLLFSSVRFLSVLGLVVCKEA